MWKVRFTPTLKLAADTTPIFSPAALMAALPASSKPVVPMMMFVPRSTHFCRWRRVGSGRVKSMSTSLWAITASASSEMAMPVFRPMAKPASRPSASEPECSIAPLNTVSGCFSTASIKTRPMRPFAPAMAIFKGFMLVFRMVYCACAADWSCRRAYSMALPSALTTRSFSNQTVRLRVSAWSMMPLRLVS